MNRLYFGDCLEVMREDISSESVDLIYLDPPFNSKRLYNAFIGGAQWVAFGDTWSWADAIGDFEEVAGDVKLANVMEGMRCIHSEGSTLAYLSYMANRLRECHRVLKNTGSIYLHCDPTMSHSLKLVMDAIFGEKNFRNEIIWHYHMGTAPKKDFRRKHDVILRYSKSNAYNGINITVPRRMDVSRYNKVDENGRRYHENGAGNRFYHDEGKKPDDVWTYCENKKFTQLNSMAKERIGYPTQKPLALLDRIVRASSNKEDIVFDPFCGCGTTIEAAENLQRYWIGIDICVNACKVIEERIKSSFRDKWADVEFIGLPKTRDDAQELANMDKFRFERWAASLVDGLEANKRQTGDRGIDGRGRIPIRKGQFIDIVSQVKGGGTGPGDIQAFNGARQEANADLGVFTCFEDRVTQRMRDAAVNTGRFLDTPIIQIYTVEDYFENRRPQMPKIP